MPVNIGPRIGIEGEDEYRKQITNLVQSTKTLDAQMKALETTSDKEATAQEKAAKAAELLSKKQEEQQKRVDKLREMVEKSAEAAGENSTKTLKWKEALANAETELNKTGKELEEAQKAAEGYGTEAEQAAEQTSKVDEAAKLLAADKLADFFQKAGEAAAKLAGAAYDAAKELDEGYDTIIKKTGASGDQLAELQGVADNVFGSMPVEMADVGTAVGELNTRFKLTGSELESTSKTFLQFAHITDTDVNSAVASTSKILKAYGGDVKDADALLGYLAKQSQDTGIETGQLMSSLEQNGATLREMGIGLQESVKLLASFEESGVDASAAMTGLRKAIVNGAKEGKSANTVLTDTISRIKNAKTDTEALQIATEVFGTRGAAVMADGIRSGRIALDNLSESMDQYGSVVADTFEATLDPWDQAKIAMNNLKTAGSNLAGEAMAVLAPAIEKVVGWIQQATEWFKGLPAPVQKVVATIGALGAGAAVVGPKILSVVNTIKSLQASANILKSVKGAADGVAESGNGLNGSFGKTAGIVAGATAALMALNSALVEASLSGNEWYQAAKEDAEAMRELQAASEGLIGAIEDRHAKEEAEQKQIQNLAAELETLNGKTSLTADEQDRYKQIVTQLTHLLPGFSGEIDENTGKLKDQEQASVDAIDALADNKRALNAADNLTQALDDQAEAVANLAKAEDVGMKWAEFFGISMDDLKTKTEGFNAESSKFGTFMARLSGNTSYTFMNQLANAAIETGAALREDEAALKATTDEVNLLSGSADTATTEIDEATLSVDAYDTAIEGAGTDTEAAATSITTSFADILAAAQKDLLGSVTYIDEWATDGGASVEDMVSTMQSNAKKYGEYTKNIQVLTSDMRYGTDRNYTNMVDMLIQQGPKGATAVDQLANEMKSGGDKMVNAMLTAYNGVTTQGGNMVASLGRTRAEAAAKLGQMPGDAANALNNYVNTISGYSSKSYSAGTSVANQAYSGMGSKNSAYSGLGQSGVSSFNTGIESKEGATESSAGVIADASAKMETDSKTAINWGANLVINFAKGMNQAAWRVSDAVDNVVKPINNKLKHSVPKEGPLSTEPEWGGHLIDNLVKGMTDSRALRTLNDAANRVSIAAMPTMQLPAGNTTNNSLTYGDIVVNVSGANVQNEQALAKAVSDQIFRRVQAQKAVWA